MQYTLTAAVHCTTTAVVVWTNETTADFKKEKNIVMNEFCLFWGSIFNENCG